MAAKKVAQASHSPGVKILLAVLGTTPAVLTEALYELIVGATNRNKEPFVPDEIHVITTSKGLAVLKENLFANQQRTGKLAELVKEYANIFEDLQISGFQLEAIPMTASSAPEPRDKVKAIPLFVTVINNDDGTALADIRGAKDIEAAETTTWNHVSKLTAHDNAEIRALVAGGRKTLSNVLHNIMTFLGRPQDKLYHVLVSEPFDSPFLEPPFFFPPKTSVDHTLIKFIQAKEKPGEISVAEAKQLNLSAPNNAKALRWIEKKQQPSQDARIELAEIRFPRLRGGIPAVLLEAGKNQRSFSDGYEDCLNIADELAVGEHDLRIDLGDQTIRVGKNCVIKGLTPVDLAFFLYVAIEHANADAEGFYFDNESFGDENSLKRYFGHYLGLTKLTTQKPTPRAHASLDTDGRIQLHYSGVIGMNGGQLTPEELLEKEKEQSKWTCSIEVLREGLIGQNGKDLTFDKKKEKIKDAACPKTLLSPVFAYVQATLLRPDERATQSFFNDRRTNCKKLFAAQLGDTLTTQLSFAKRTRPTKYYLPIAASRISICDTQGSVVSIAGGLEPTSDT